MSIRLPFDPFALNRPANLRPILQELDRLPILVTGVAGVVGFNAFHYLQQKYPGQVIGIRPTSNWRLIGDGIVGLDPEDEHATREFFREYDFGSVLSCGGSCALKSCELDPAMADRVNVQSVRSILRAAESRPLRLVHLSIDLVYSGDQARSPSGGYREDDPTDPVTIYGSTMVQAEDSIRTLRPDAMTLRISLPMGISFNGHAGAIDWIQSRFSKGLPATLYYDEIRTPTYCQCLNERLEEALANDWSGLYHAGGPTRLSLYQIAQIVNLVGGYDPDLLHGCDRIQAGPMPPRAGDVSMNSEKLQQQFGFSPFKRWPFDPQWMPEDRDWHYRRQGYDDLSPDNIARQLYLPSEAFA